MHTYTKITDCMLLFLCSILQSLWKSLLHFSEFSVVQMELNSLTCLPVIFLFKSKDQKLLLQLLTKACVLKSLLCFFFFFFEQSKLDQWKQKLKVPVPEAVPSYRRIRIFCLAWCYSFRILPPCPNFLCVCQGIVILPALLSLPCASLIGLLCSTSDSDLNF